MTFVGFFNVILFWLKNSGPSYFGWKTADQANQLVPWAGHPRHSPGWYNSVVKEISARNPSVQLISTYEQTPCIFELTQCIYKIIESGPILVKGYVKVRKFAIPMRFKSLHPRMQSIWAHCLYLVLNTQETSHFYWQ